MSTNGHHGAISAPPQRRQIIAVGLPTFDDVKADFALSLAMMVAATRDVTFAFCHSKATWVAHARNLIVEGALDLKADYILFIDFDMTFPRDTLSRLMKWDQDVVCASYVKKKPPYHIVGKLIAKPGDDLGKQKFVEANGLYEMENFGLGVCLIKAEVFHKMSKPWFHYEYNPGSNVMTGEDILWCAEARALGYRLWLDAALSMQVGHIGNYIFRPEGADVMFDEDTGRRKQDIDAVQEHIDRVAANG